MSGGGAIGALFFTLGVMVLFIIMFSTFLIVPFFIFLGGIVAMIVSDRKNSRRKKENEVDRDLDDDTEVRVVETRVR